MKLNLHTGAALEYSIKRVRNGKVIESRPFRRNMITDAGLNRIGAEAWKWVEYIFSFILGDSVSPTPVRRDSGAIKFTQSGTTITADAPFFESADTGRLFKWGTGSAGSECYLTYVNSTTATASVSATVAVPEIGTVWYVNTAALNSPIAGLSISKLNGSGSTSFNVVGDTCEVTSEITLQSSAFSSNRTVTEIAINNNTTNSNVFDRDLVNPPIAFLSGDQAEVTVRLIRNYSPVTPVSVGNVATGFDSSGDFQIESLSDSNVNGSPISIFDSNGNAGTSGFLDPSSNGLNAGPVNAAITLQTFNATTTTSRSTARQSATTLAYGTGTFYREKVVTIPINIGNSANIYGIAVTKGVSAADYGNAPNCITLKLNTPFAKTNTQILTITFRASWQRVLIN